MKNSVEESMPRRTFLKQMGLGAAVALGAPASGLSGANERLTLGLIGCGGQGRGHAGGYPDADFAYVCDPDEERCQKAKQKAGAAHAVSDLRRILDDKSVDAVVIAACDHWHGPAAIMACEAGKHVYVEKPCSHNFREGQLMLEAARRNNCVVQVGTQYRSHPVINKGIQLIREGVIGDVLVAKAWNVEKRRNIGKMGPSAVPPGVDYDMWVGPAEFVPFQRNRFHYEWHWWHNFGTGSMGNSGSHDMDYARWGLGVEGHPSRVCGLGGKYFFDDDQEFEDTATVVFEWPGDGKVGSKRQLIYEIRIWSDNFPQGCDMGAEFYGTKGTMVLSLRGKIQILDAKNRPLDVEPKNPPRIITDHRADFVDAVKTGRRPNADIEDGYLSGTLCHLGNICMRVRRTLHFDPQKEQIVGDKEANSLLRRNYRKNHWAIPKGV